MPKQSFPKKYATSFHNSSTNDDPVPATQTNAPRPNVWEVPERYEVHPVSPLPLLHVEEGFVLPLQRFPPYILHLQETFPSSTENLSDIRSCAILYLLKGGIQWRMLPSDFPNWKLVYYYFTIWSKPDETGESLLDRVLKKPYILHLQETFPSSTENLSDIRSSKSHPFDRS